MLNLAPAPAESGGNQAPRAAPSARAVAHARTHYESNRELEGFGDPRAFRARRVGGGRNSQKSGASALRACSGMLLRLRPSVRRGKRSHFFARVSLRWRPWGGGNARIFAWLRAKNFAPRFARRCLNSLCKQLKFFARAARENVIWHGGRAWRSRARRAAIPCSGEVITKSMFSRGCLWQCVGGLRWQRSGEEAGATASQARLHIWPRSLAVWRAVGDKGSGGEGGQARKASFKQGSPPICLYPRLSPPRSPLWGGRGGERRGYKHIGGEPCLKLALRGD